MANHDVTKTHKSTGEIWVGLAVPAVGSELTLDANGEPDATENPNALNLGLTEEGATMTITREIEDDNYDNYKQPLGSEIIQTGGRIEAVISMVRDIDVLEFLSIGVGTNETVTGKDKIRLGESALTYGSVAVISKQRFDPTKFLVTHLYNALNVGEMILAMSRQTRSGMPINLQGYAIGGREVTDSFGAIWWDQ